MNFTPKIHIFHQASHEPVLVRLRYCNFGLLEEFVSSSKSFKSLGIVRFVSDELIRLRVVIISRPAQRRRGMAVETKCKSVWADM